jgi:hypothetical protein
MMTLMPVLGLVSGVAETAILGSLDSSILARSGIQGDFNWAWCFLNVQIGQDLGTWLRSALRGVPGFQCPVPV